ncbi:MAG: hypothetical protein KTR25_02970 [Myxococcales bacterium]|nr:hypothetical protein [Myxococcales bacterium]
MKGPDHEKSLLGHVLPGTLASSSERFTKSRARQLHTWPNQPAVNAKPSQASYSPPLTLSGESHAHLETE